MPEPAGINLPMMMFSLRPIRLSPLPSMAASVSTLGGSWNGAAGSGDPPGGLLNRRRRQPRLGGQRRLGDPHQLGTTLGRLLAVFDHPTVGVAEDLGVGTLAGEEGGVAGLLHADAARHLANDQLDVLVADRHA